MSDARANVGPVTHSATASGVGLDGLISYLEDVAPITFSRTAPPAKGAGLDDLISLQAARLSKPAAEQSGVKCAIASNRLSGVATAGIRVHTPLLP